MQLLHLKSKKTGPARFSVRLMEALTARYLAKQGLIEEFVTACGRTRAWVTGSCPA
ncbi:MAG: hypothetical protein KDD19_21040 [Phaeodactylibacter sp.]|nr:hypothetical protein [Phaeodactylibacter sp.]MCB9052452.1 hypothetical protein [Lewinellaceae bacterium]